ncbi:MAG: 2-oxoacid:acceptor oxidoreductase subunit alpha [Chitinophagales bacterium]|nr:2-oxoacid:acceptor oxidoreductase subunit alpha [Chitinophagales bacterium]
MTKETVVNELDRVVIKFAGDSGDGMQLTGSQFTDTSAMLGNDLATFPDYPAEIRAPQGTVAGVSGFQVHIGKITVYHPGDKADVLVAMNPAALKANMKNVKTGGTIIVDIDNFTTKNFDKAGFDSDPLKNDLLKDYSVIEVGITSLTKECLKDIDIDGKSVTRSKNMFALGMVYWMFSRPLDQTEKFLETKFAKKPLLIEANKKVLYAGLHYAETIEALASSYTVLPALYESGLYRNISGNVALAWGLITAAIKSKRTLFFGSYPITPASDILHEVAKHKHFGAKIFQAEDEIAAAASAIGASFAGALGVTSSSGPGIALKGEAIGLAVMTELPLVVLNIQRGGPSTGLPTKTEQSDLLQVLFGRNGECPAIVIAASTPANCFDFAYEACRLSIEHMTPVFFMSDGYLGNGAEPWRIKSLDDMPEIRVPLADKSEEDFQPYRRNPETLVRKWAVPGTPNLVHRIGGLEKEDITGNVSYDPLNHEFMTKIRAEKISKVADNIPELTVDGAQQGDLLVVGWGGTYGHLYTTVTEMHAEGKSIGLAHFNYINPLPKNTDEIFKKFKKILVCELNLGQFVNYLRMMKQDFKYLQFNKVQGLPFSVAELKDQFENLLEKK